MVAYRYLPNRTVIRHRRLGGDLTPKFSCSRINKSERSEPSFDRLTAATHVIPPLRRTYVTVKRKQPQLGPLVAIKSHRPGVGMVVPDGKKYSRKPGLVLSGTA